MKYVLFLVAMCISTVAYCQDETPNKNAGLTSFYAELGGPGILFSANLDRRFGKTKLGLGGRVGLGFVTGDFEESNNVYKMQSVVTFPLQLNYVFGKENSAHTFEVGAGLTITGKKLDIFDFEDEKATSVFGTASFMYRRQPTDGGFSWRIGFSPLMANGYIQPFGGVSVGYNF